MLGDNITTVFREMSPCSQSMLNPITCSVAFTVLSCSLVLPCLGITMLLLYLQEYTGGIVMIGTIEVLFST